MQIYLFFCSTLLKFPITKALLGNPAHTGEWKGRKSVLSEEHLHKKYNLHKSIEMGPLPPVIFFIFIFWPISNNVAKNILLQTLWYICTRGFSGKYPGIEMVDYKIYLQDIPMFPR